MSVSVVSHDSLAEPQDVGCPELVLEHRFDFGTSEAGVPDLNDRVEQALFCGEQGAAPVDVDAATFEHELPRLGPKQPQLEPRRDALGHAIVELPIGVLGPGVESKLGDRERGGRAGPAHEDGPEIAGPAAVCREAEELEAVGPHAHLREHASGAALVVGGIDQDPHELSPGERARDLSVHPGDRAKLARPIAGVVRPADPGGVMRFPLGGHAEAEARGRLRHYERSSRNRLVIPP